KYDPLMVATSDLTRQSTEQAMSQLLELKRKPTAIVAFNDYVAFDAMQFALKQGYTIYRDICFVSYANLPMSGYTAFPPMASVEQFPYRQGENATQMLFKMMEKKSPVDSLFKIIIEPELIIPHLQHMHQHVAK
ncbi:MAG: substrate-binding domain-containing protein, partial [Chitinophagaceae bacterium]